jgi:L-rhamnose mutarotase
MTGPQRFGMVARLVPELREEYLALHRAVWPQVEATITECGIRNFTIFVRGDVIVGYYEYVGDDYEADMAGIAADAETQRWWQLTDAMQEPDPARAAGAWWLDLPEVFHTD